MADVRVPAVPKKTIGAGLRIAPIRLVGAVVERENLSEIQGDQDREAEACKTPSVSLPLLKDR